MWWVGPFRTEKRISLCFSFSFLLCISVFCFIVRLDGCGAVSALASKGILLIELGRAVPWESAFGLRLFSFLVRTWHFSFLSFALAEVPLWWFWSGEGFMFSRLGFGGHGFRSSFALLMPRPQVRGCVCEKGMPTD